MTWCSHPGSTGHPPDLRNRGAGQYQVPAEPAAARGESREAHPDVQGNARLLWQDFHWAEHRDRGHHPVKGGPDRRSRSLKMIIQVGKRSAGVHLVLIGEAPPASRALPHRCQWDKPIIRCFGLVWPA